MHRGLPHSRLSSSKLVACGPPGTSCSTFPSFGMIPSTTGPTCDDDACVLINLSFIQELIETEPRQVLLFCTIFLFDRS
jgi:hypothetical protein